MVLIVKTLWTRRRIVVPGVIFAALLGIVAAFHVKPAFPPGLHSRETQAFVADSQILIDSPVSAIGDLDQGLDGPDVRATVYANLMTTTSLIKSVATVAGVPADQLSVAGPLSTNGQATSAAGYHQAGRDQIGRRCHLGPLRLRRCVGCLPGSSIGPPRRHSPVGNPDRRAREFRDDADRGRTDLPRALRWLVHACVVRHPGAGDLACRDAGGAARA
jgi:hypothetical protein